VKEEEDTCRKQRLTLTLEEDTCEGGGGYM